MPREHFYFRAWSGRAQCAAVRLSGVSFLHFQSTIPRVKFTFAERAHSVPRFSNIRESFCDASLNYAILEPNYAKMCVRPVEWKAPKYRYSDGTTNDPIPPGLRLRFCRFCARKHWRGILGAFATTRSTAGRRHCGHSELAPTFAKLSRKWKDRRFKFAEW